MIGTIDEPAIFDSPLSETEINDLMNNGLQKSLSIDVSGKLAASWSNIKLGY
jgi:hypothetical protein